MGYEDDDLFLRMFRAGYTNYFLDKPVTVWCIHRGSTSWSVKMSRSRFRYFEKLCHLYPDDEEKEIFYFRDCFIPRFADNFIDDALSAAAKETKDAVELLQILKRFGEMVCANRSVKDEYKLLILRIIDVVETGAISRAHYGKYQRSVQELYQSTSWRATRPFRSLCNVLRGIPGAADVVPDSEDGARSLFDHLVQSNSWKLSAPVRITKRAVTFFGAGGNVGNQFQTRRIEGPTVR
jgi:hypothetical protein